MAHRLGETGLGVDRAADRDQFVGDGCGIGHEPLEPGSDALGKVRVGDVVVEVNFQPVTSNEQAIKAAEQAKAQGKPVLLMIWGEQEMRFVSVRTK